MEKRYVTKKEIKELWKQEEIYWGARAKVNWLKLGDRNSKYFHASTLKRRENNAIHSVKDSNGDWRNDKEGIMHAFNDYFKDIYRGNEDNGEQNALQYIHPLITPHDNNLLLKEVQDYEVRNVVFSLGANKAPDPDGLSGMFYQKSWNVIVNDITKMVRNFFKYGTLPEKINETHIILVPKIPHPEEIGHFRPISCCNFLMKIITRIMALRMKPLMNKIITMNQSAFVEGRQIQDNLLIVREAFHSLKKKKQKNSTFYGM